MRGRPWMITSGYQDAPQATAKVWRNGWFHTGDLFRQDANGNFIYANRSKDMIRRRGENIISVAGQSAASGTECSPLDFLVAVAAVGHD